MRANNMKIPPLSQLYQQKQTYEVHRKRIQQIMLNRKSSSVHSVFKEQKSRRYGSNFERKSNTKSLQIAQANNRILQKIKKVKPSFSIHQSLTKQQELRTLHASSDRKRTIEQQRQNYRIKSRVKSMTSSLNKQNLKKDYEKSMQIKNRLVHFKTEHNNKVVMKVERYMGNNSRSQTSLNAKKSKQMHLISKDSPKKEDIDTLKVNKELISSHMKKNHNALSKFYQKDQILKNKIQNSHKMFKMAKEKRIKAITMLQKSHHFQKKSIAQEQSTLFPTEPNKQTI